MRTISTGPNPIYELTMLKNGVIHDQITPRVALNDQLSNNFTLNNIDKFVAGDILSFTFKSTYTSFREFQVLFKRIK